MREHYLSELFGLRNKVALVTGASRGLGKAMALALAAAGAKLVIVSSKHENLTDTKNQLESEGVEVLALACDQTKAEEIDEVIKIAHLHFGCIDILINNAGTIRRAPAHLTSDEDWDAVIDTNLNGVFRFCRGVGELMLKQGAGKIINIASLLSFSGGVTVPAYAASKGALAQLTKALANEWAEHNIQVNAIAPGYFATDNTEALRKDEARSASILARIPSKRWGQGQDLAGAAVFLSSSASDYVNGHILLVDGGWMAR